MSIDLAVNKNRKEGSIMDAGEESSNYFRIVVETIYIPFKLMYLLKVQVYLFLLNAPSLKIWKIDVNSEWVIETFINNFVTYTRSNS